MKSPRGRKAGKTAAKPATPARGKKGNNLIDPESRKLFLVHFNAYVAADEKVRRAQNAKRTLEKTIKSDGFKISQIKDAVLLSTPEGEAQFKQEMANRLLAAQYVGADIGEQLSLFMDEPRVPATDRAAKEGQADAAQNKAMRPKYDPSTPQYKAYADAYHEEQGRQVKAGIGKLDAKSAAANAKAGKSPAKAATGKKRGRPAAKKGANAEPAKGSERTLIPKAEKDAKAAARAPKADAGPPRAAVTRSQVRARTGADAKAEAESYFSKKGDTAGNA